MIVTHPFLFYTIVVLFIAFTSGWVVFVIIGRRAIHLKNKMNELENEKEDLRRHAEQLEEQLQEPYPLNSTPVISLSSSIKASKTNDAGV
jgi:hypothetical protein